MNLYARKLARELWRHKGQSGAVLAVTALGVFLFISSAAGYLDLDRSYQDTRTRLALAELHIDAEGLTEQDVAAASSSPGVAAAQARVVTSLPVTMPSSDGEPETKVELRVLSLPDDAEPRLDKVLLLSGAWPGRGEVLLEKHVAGYHHLGRGDVVTVHGPGFQRQLTVSGVGASAEYLWVSRDENDLLTSASSFGVGWMRRGALRSVASALIASSPVAAGGVPALAAAASPLAGNQLLVETSGGSDAEVLRALEQRVGPQKLRRAVREQDLPGVRLLQMDVDGYKGMAAFFPLFFLGVGAFIVASVLSRLVDAQKPVIGTLLALGVSRGRLLRHYMAYAAALGGSGALVGAALGVISGRALTHEYAKELGIPFVVARAHWDLAAVGVALGLGVSLLSGLLPAIRASRLHPAESMRPPRPSTGPLARLSRSLQAPLPARLAVRDILGRPLRSLGTAFGVAAALVLVITTGAMLDSMRVTFETLFQRAQRFDQRVDLLGPLPREQVERQLKGIAGIAGAEGVLTLPVAIARGDRSADALLQGLTPHARLLRSFDVNGAEVAPPPGGIVLTRALAKKLGARVGDQVAVHPQPSGASARWTVTGFADAAMGPVASVPLADAQRAFGLEGRITTVLTRSDRGAGPRVRAALSDLPGAARVQDVAAMRGQLDQMMGLGWLLLGTMLLFSAVLAAAILFNTATLNILERRRDLATLRALGRSMREIAFNVTLEHALIATLGFALGLPLAIAASRALLDLYSSDLFALPFVLTPQTVASAALGVVLVLLLSQWPALRAVRRTPLAEAVRSREG